MKSKLWLLGLCVTGCVSKAKLEVHENKGQVIKKSRDAICNNLTKIIDKGSKCAEKNPELFAEGDISQADFENLCSTARNYKALGLGSVAGKSFRDWYIAQLSSYFEYQQERMERIRHIMRQYADGYGLGIGVKAAAGASIGGMAEIITHDQEIALFCAASLGVTTDVGVAADIVAIKTLGCETNRDYTGQFAAISLDGSFEFSGLPVGVGGSFNLGIDLTKLIEQFVPYWQNNRLAIKQDLLELDAVNLEDDSVRLTRDIILTLFHTVETATNNSSAIGENLKNMINASRDHLESYKQILQNQNKHFNLNENLDLLQQRLEKVPAMKHLPAALKILTSSFSGCNSLTFYAGFSVSVLPMSLSISLSQYEILSEVPLPSFASMNQFVSDLYDFTQTDRSQKCEFNESQAKAYIQILKLLKTMDQARSLAPGLANITQCHKQLIQSSLRLSDFIKQQIQ